MNIRHSSAHSQRPSGLRIAILNWRDLDHPEAGGAELVSQQLANLLTERNHRVTLVAARVECRPRSERHPDGYRIVRGGSRLGVYPFALSWLLRHRYSVDAVIDCQNGIPFFSPLVLPRRTPLLLLIHHVHQEQFAKYFSPAMAALGRWLEGPASRAVYGRRGVIAISPSTRKGIRRVLKLRGNIWVTPPGWSVTPEVLEQPGPRAAHPHVVSVGRLVPHKRTDLLIEGFVTVLRRHPDATLTIVGRGPERSELIALADSLGLGRAVSFRDDLDDAGRDRMLSTGWMTVHPSQGEGWGLSVLEGNVFGVPALAYDRPGLRDSIVADETGWLIPDDADLGTAIADCLAELRDPGRASQLAQRTRHWADRFTWDRMVEQTLEALASERARLQLAGEDRRGDSDLATVITVPARELPTGWRARLRTTDTWEQSSPEEVTLLCRGADTQIAGRLLSRLGVRDDLTLGEDYLVSVARTKDLLRLTTTATREGADANRDARG